MSTGDTLPRTDTVSRQRQIHTCAGQRLLSRKTEGVLHGFTVPEVVSELTFARVQAAVVFIRMTAFIQSIQEPWTLPLE